MSSIHETAYPRIKPDLSQKELADIYTPTVEDSGFAMRHARQPTARICLLVLLKSVQRLGYFPPLAEVPPIVVRHITTSTTARNIALRQLRDYDTSGTRQRHIKKIREFLSIRPFGPDGERVMQAVAERASETKQALPDIINEVIEELIKQRFELPAYSTLLRAARRARSEVNNRCYAALHSALTPTAKSIIDELLTPGMDDHQSGWNQLKREPKQPKHKEIKSFLQHLRWLTSIATQMPTLNAISASRREQYLMEARSLHAHSVRELKIAKRYALAVVLIQVQRQKALDSIADIFIRKMQGLHNLAELRLQQYHLEQVKRTEKLIGRFRDVLTAYQREEGGIKRLHAIGSALKADPLKLIVECDEYMAYASNNYWPFMLESYGHWRPLLFSCVESLELKSTTSDQNLIRAIQFIFAHRTSHKEWLPIQGHSGQGIKNQINLQWLPEQWRKLVTGHPSANTKVTEIHRKYFELCVFTQIQLDLKSADLYVCHSDKYADYREQLVGWDTYDDQIEEYGQLVSLSTDAQSFVRHLRQKLIDIAQAVDQKYPDNEYLELTPKGPVIRKHEAEEKSKAVEDVDAQLRERMSEISILDILVEAERWLDLHKLFGPISGFETKLNDPRLRFITTLFCYGCNLGPTQTAQSVQGLSRKQLAWLNLRHITEERLEKAIVAVINAYNRFLLPKFWGTGKGASADGTKWNLYEQNLLSEYHIRYGGYGRKVRRCLVWHICWASS